MTAPQDVAALLRSRNYLKLLVLAGVLGAPVAAIAYWFLYLSSDLQKWIYRPRTCRKRWGFTRHRCGGQSR